MRTVTLTLLMVALFGTLSGYAQSRIDLAKLGLDEPLKKVINVDGTGLSIGMSTLESPDAMIFECYGTNAYSFNGIALDSVNVMFKVNSKAYKKKIKEASKFGGAQMEIQGVKGIESLEKILQEEKSDGTIFGCIIALKPRQTAKIKAALEQLYGKGTPNKNTDNGLYWNIVKDNKLILFAPNLDHLVMINNKQLSKACYWDPMNGFIDLGGCDKDKYFNEFFDSE